MKQLVYAAKNNVIKDTDQILCFHKLFSWEFRLNQRMQKFNIMLNDQQSASYKYKLQFAIFV